MSPLLHILSTFFFWNPQDVSPQSPQTEFFLELVLQNTQLNSHTHPVTQKVSVFSLTAPVCISLSQKHEQCSPPTMLVLFWQHFPSAFNFYSLWCNDIFCLFLFMVHSFLLLLLCSLSAKKSHYFFVHIQHCFRTRWWWRLCTFFELIIVNQLTFVIMNKKKQQRKKKRHLFSNCWMFFCIVMLQIWLKLLPSNMIMVLFSEMAI